jgi:hypothetical protein
MDACLKAGAGAGTECSSRKGFAEVAKEDPRYSMRSFATFAEPLRPLLSEIRI